MISCNQTLVNMQADGAALASSTTATSLLHATGLYILPTNFFEFVGQKMRVKAAGRISTVVTTAKTMTFDLKFGSTIVATSGALTMSVSALSNVAWELEWDLTCRAVGVSTTTTLMHQGRLTSEACGSTTVAGEAKSIMIPVSSPAVGTGFAWNATQAVDLFGTWSVNSASNSITCHQFELISLNKNI